MEAGRFVASADAFAIDEDSGHSPGSSLDVHVVLDVAAIGVAFNVLKLDEVVGYVIGVEYFLRNMMRK